MKKLVLLAVGLATVALIGGCATAMSKSEYTIDVITKKPNVKFKVFNRKGAYVHQGVTPMMVTLPAQSKYFTKEIYTIKTDQGKTRVLTATISPWFWGNFVTAFIGGAVDGVTGAMWAFPKEVNLDLKQKDDIVSNSMNL